MAWKSESVTWNLCSQSGGENPTGDLNPKPSEKRFSTGWHGALRGGTVA